MSESENESWLVDLLEKRRSGLKATLTKVRNGDGSVNVDDHDVVVNVEAGTTGFVVDTKPDLSVAHVTPWLWISSQDVPAHPTILQSLNVTHVLSLLPAFQVPQS